MYKKFLCSFVFLLFAFCLALGNLNAATTICKWKDNKQGAFTMSFDDALWTQRNYVVPNLLSRNLPGTVYIPPGNGLYGYGIMVWEALASRSLGLIDFANHTFYHANPNGNGFPPNITAYSNEIARTAQLMWSLRTPGSSKLQTYATPGTWNSTLVSYWYQMPAALTANYCFPGHEGRNWGEVRDDAMGGLTRARMNLSSAAATTNWYGFHWHGTGTQAEYLYFDRGWQAPEFAMFLDDCVNASTYVWIGSNTDQHMYFYEYMSAYIAGSTVTATDIYVTVRSTQDASLYNYPLTLITDVPAGWTHCKITQGNQVRITTVTANKCMYNAVPAIEAHLQQANGFDLTPPSNPGAVRDGTGTDASIITNLNQISANWDASTDAETGILRYWYKVGTTAGGAEVFDWIDNGTFTWVTTSRTNLSLSRGTTYYITVKAVNGCGLESGAVTSNGQRGQEDSAYIRFIDDFETGDFSRWGATPSQGGGNTIQVVSGAGYSGNYGLRVHMNGTATTAATIAKANVSSLTDAYIQFYVKFEDLVLPQLNSMGEANWGNKCFCILQYRGASGNFLGGIYMGKAENGLNLYHEYIENVSSYSCVPSWPGQYWGWLPVSTNTWHCFDVHIKADSTSNGGVEMWIDQEKVFSYLHRPTPNSLVSTLTIGAVTVGASTTTGNIYFDNLKVSDSYIYVAQSAPPPPPIDSTPPSAPATVNDGTGADITETNSTTQLSANWTSSADAESGISKYWYAIGTTPGATDIVAWTDNGALTGVTKTGLTLTDGQAYYFTVKAENGVSLPGAATNSNGQTINVDAPPPEIVITAPSYPNPYSLSSNQPMKLHVTNTSGAEIMVFTLSGRLVKKLTIPAGSHTLNWDVKNEDGEKIKPGLYIAKITDAAGAVTTSKIALTK